MKLRPDVAYALRLLSEGQDPYTSFETFPEPWKAIATHLRDQAYPTARRHAWNAMAPAIPGIEQVRDSLRRVDPSAGPPDVPQRRFATVADLRAQLSAVGWTWPGWIPASRVVGVAAFEGTGKTRFLLDLARILYLGLPWPDGQPATLPAGTRTLWLCADGHQDEIAETLPGFGLPDDAVVFPAHPDEPYDGTSLDDGELVGEGGILEEAIREVRPGLVVVDTLTNATARDLCAQAQMKSLKDPLVRLVQRHGINIVLSLHLNKEGQALGRRVRGITRTLIHLECPDPARSGRLRLWVEKSYGMKPPALGVTMGEHGNTYDDAPPPRAEPGEATPSGRPPERRGKAVEFLREALGRENDQLGNDLCRAWVAEGGGARTFWRAVDQLEEAGELVSDGGPGTRKPKVLHLIVTE